MSDTKFEIPDYLHEAAKIFLGELDGHIEAITKFLKSPPEALSADDCRPILERFHVMKGGAGFLHLRTLKEAATKGESLMKEVIKGTSNPKLREEIAPLIEILRSEKITLQQTLEG